MYSLIFYFASFLSFLAFFFSFLSDFTAKQHKSLDLQQHIMNGKNTSTFPIMIPIISNDKYNAPSSAHDPNILTVPSGHLSLQIIE